MMKSNQRYRDLFNPVSLAGVVLTVVALGVMLLFFLLEVLFGLSRPYLGIFLYMILPAIMVLGLILVPAGMILRRRRQKKEGTEEMPLFPILDLNDPRQRRGVIFFTMATVVFVLIIAVSSYQAFHFTESPAFCGLICHKTMEPEYTAWKNSPHARVACVSCHIGPGAEWYVRAKFSGLRQIYRTALDMYEKPIRTPVEHLRPSRDICEQCHWPEQFYKGRQESFYHYAQDEKNSPRETVLLFNVSGTPKDPNAHGIHWHIANEVSYYARDRERLDMAYIVVRDRDGRVREYFDTEKPPTPEELSRAKMRVMDCTDCHNRPTHILRSPQREMDDAFVSGKVDITLPYLKKVVVEALEKTYPDEAAARRGIESHILDFYGKNYPEIAKKRGEAIRNAVREALAIYERNFFPHMQVTWRTYPDHLGHFYSPGCFRCHNEKYQTKDGKTISKDCNLCHTLISQKQENIPRGAKVTRYVHPVDIGEELTKMNCSDCHLARR